MYKKFLFVLLLLAAGTAMVNAETAKPTPTPIPRALPVEKEKKPGFFQKIFKKKPTPTPTPVATASPTAAPKKKKIRPVTAIAEATPSSSPLIEPLTEESSLPPVAGGEALPPPSGDSLPASIPPLVEVKTGGKKTIRSTDNIPPSPVADGTKEATLSHGSETAIQNTPPDSLPIARPTPVAPEVRANPLNQPIALVDGASVPVSITASASPEAALETETLRRIQFRKVKAKALEDAKLLELKQKSEQAASSAERLTALKSYYPKLFASMRKLDETLSVEIDEMEAASRRRLERLESESSTQSN